MLSLKLLYPVDPAAQHGAFLCVLSWPLAASGPMATLGARLLVLSKN